MANEPSEIPPGHEEDLPALCALPERASGSSFADPAAIVESGAKVAREQGVCRTAQVLRLEYGKLKRIAESDGRFPIPSGSRKGRAIRRSRASLPATTDAPRTRAGRTRSVASLPSFLEMVGSSAIAG